MKKTGAGNFGKRLWRHDPRFLNSEFGIRNSNFLGQKQGPYLRDVIPEATAQTNAEIPSVVRTAWARAQFFASDCERSSG
jgi:hypothetical protein